MRCAAKIGSANCVNHRPLIGGRSSNLSAQMLLGVVTLGERRSQELLTGREFEVFRPTDLWYSTMKAGEIPQTRSRSVQKKQCSERYK
jgi:hypothetical protein